MQVTLGAHRILPEIEQALYGMLVGEIKTITARFPEDYGARQVAGKQAEFELKPAKIEEQSLPPVDEAFARAFGIENGGVPELRTEVRSSMERELAEAIRVRLREQLFDALYRDNPRLEAPQGMVEEQIRDLQAQALHRMGSQDPTQAPAAREPEPRARQCVALGLLIGEMVRAQGLKVDRARVEQRLETLAASYPDPQEVRRQYLAVAKRCSSSNRRHWKTRCWTGRSRR